MKTFILVGALVMTMLLVASVFASSNRHALRGAKKRQQGVSSTGILQVQVISRHGDRLPTSSAQIPKDPVNWPLVSGFSLGDLTGLGQKECYKLGKKLRARYLRDRSPSQIQGITEHYNATHYLFRSTNFDRALNSMVSIAQGLFPPGTGNRAIKKYRNPEQDLHRGQFSLPHGVQSVPIHTVADNMENLLLGFTYCNTVQKRTQTAFITRVFPYIAARRTFFDRLYNETGWTGGDATISTLIDLLQVQKYHDMIHIDWVNENWHLLEQYRDEILLILYGYDVIGKEGSSILITTLLDNIAQFKKKYIHYSAHDSTLQALAAALRLNDADSGFSMGLPKYGAHFVLELHQMNDGNRTVRLLYGEKYDSEHLTPLVLAKLGCESEFCPLATFKAGAELHGTTGSTPWCEACANKSQDVCAPYFLKNVPPCPTPAA
ncbi:hypothetical protein C9374_010941 [Naegleria lovaniensis]|uniref:Acid phosphatase n=1 Tax=Naegleria lovaniensis TaxID=51637 RepID=A0AA88GHS8_NAELO|nr:uncharacterized protein C9374_010941 [Naegleria lovaniensis]KAG2374371.1 hypothetical protein C9374_010941 [Naegleria lovaniensis]